MRSWLAFLCAAVLLGQAAEVRAEAPAAGERQIRAVVLLVVLGEFPEALVDAVASELERVYQVEVRRRAAIPLPKEAWYAPRRRYRAEVLLEHLAKLADGMPRGTRVLGLTSVDISTTNGDIKDWGIFGLGSLDGTSGVVSGYRLWKKTKDRKKVAWRVTNTAVHELGHVLGLNHCEEPRCVMLDAQGGIANTDASTGVPGPACAAALDRMNPLRPASTLR